MMLRKYDDDQNFAIDLSACARRDIQELPSLKRLISTEDRRRFLKKLFGGDSSRYESILEQLEPVPQWAEAHRLVQSFFNYLHINPYHDEAIRFSDVIYKRYFPLDVYVQEAG